MNRFLGISAALLSAPFFSQAKPVQDADLPWPPTLPGGKKIATDKSEKFLTRPDTLRDDVQVAKEAPTIDLLLYPGQDYPGKPWSNWGDGCVADGKYYSAIGDHYALGRGEAKYGAGAALLYEYDPQTKTLRALANTTDVLKLPADHYRPGKIHSRIDMGSDGWLYYATHRGSPKAAIDANHYRGDWILRTHPGTGRTEVVAHGPVPKHSIPNSLLDPERLIFYAGTAAGPDAPLQDVRFFAYDLRRRKLLHANGDGPARYMFLARSTGKLYYVPGNADGELLRYDPAAQAPPQPTGRTLGIRAATMETPDGFVYTVSTGQRSGKAMLWQFDVAKETVKALGDATAGAQSYVASLDAGPAGRYLYYVPGAHGGGYKDGSPVVQFDVRTGLRKVIAFLHPFYNEKYGLTPKGTYSTAVSAEGDKVFITWNVSRGARAWDCCALTVVHVPESERPTTP